MSLISTIINNQIMPIYDNVDYARGCECFIFRAKNRNECRALIDDFIYTVPTTKMVKVYNIGLRPDYPIPVARYFAEVCVDDLSNIPRISLWTYVTMGVLAQEREDEED